MYSKVENAIISQMKRDQTPFYIYDEQTILAQTSSLKQHFPGFEFLYSIKTNPFEPVVKTVLSNGLGLDAASLREVEIGVEHGLKPSSILYSAPGKTERDIRGAIDHSIIIADSLGELELINRIAAQEGKKLRVGVRINPDFTMDSDSGSSGKFGVDEALLFEAAEHIRTLSSIEIVGIHVHSRSQELNWEVLQRYYSNVFALAERCTEKLEVELEFVNLGGGIGIAYSSEHDSPLDTKTLGQRSAELVQQLRTRLGIPRIIIETGRYAVCTAGYFATTVVDVKESYSKKYVMVASTLNGFIRPSLAMLIAAYLPEGAHAKANEPLFTTMDAFDFKLLTDCTETETVSLVGNLCTGADIMARDITLPKAKVGDILTISKAGSYAYVLTPTQFSSQPGPYQFLLREDGSLEQ